MPHSANISVISPSIAAATALQSSSIAPKIALVAGEASGDQLGADLIRELRKKIPHAQFAGIGGQMMIAEGQDAWHHANELSVMGLAEVLRHLPRLLKLRRQFVNRLLQWQPDIFIGIDAPDFNLAIERRLKKVRIPTVHYVSPSVWAWRPGRASKIGRAADRVLCLFPMEPPIYQRHGVDARFVGHPLADQFALAPNKPAARKALGIEHSDPLLALLPGSRISEVSKLAPDFLRAAALCVASIPQLKIIAPMANSECRASFESILKSHFANDKTPLNPNQISVINGNAHQVLVASDCVLLASGTAALEALLAHTPMVVAYRLSKLSYRIVTAFNLMKVDRYSLPNVLAGEGIVPELMQDKATPAGMADAILNYLHNPEKSAALIPRFESIHSQLRCGASERAAEAVLELLAPPPLRIV